MSESKKNSFDNKPDTWLTGEVISIGNDMYAQFREDLNEPNPYIWMYIPTMGDTGRWMGFPTTEHDLISKSPLHLEPSLLLDLGGVHKGIHGFIRDGKWADA